MAPKRKASKHDLQCEKPTRRPYVYETLLPGEIRLLVLYPGQGDEILQGTLNVVPRDKSPAYRAISYAWGNPVFPHTLHLPTGQLPITKSLHGALKRFRSKTQRVHLWADAVCINQSDIQEKNHQVTAMDEIYNDAREVLVWLGEAKDTDCLALWTLQLLESCKSWGSGTKIGYTFCPGDLPRRCTKNLEFKFKKNVAADERCQCCGVSPVDRKTTLHGALNAVTRSIWSRPWFERVWVLQEITFGRAVLFYFGNHVTGIDHLSAVCNVQKDYIDNTEMILNLTPEIEHPDKCNMVLNVWDSIPGLFSTKEQVEPLHLLLRIKDLKVSDPRDRVFALRAILEVKGMRLLTPDYSLECSELWTRVVASVFEDSGSIQEPWFKLTVLAIAGCQSGRKCELLPSWVPDFGNLSEECVLKGSFYLHERGFQHAGGMSQVLESYMRKNRSVIRLRGAVVCRIHAIKGDTMARPTLDQSQRFAPKEDYWLRLRHDLIHWYLDCHKFGTAMSCIPNFQKKMRDLLLHGQEVHYLKPYVSYEEFSTVLRTATKAAPEALDPTMIDIQEMYKGLRPFLTQRGNFLSIDPSRILAATADGHIGWVPGTTQVDDIVCVFEGGQFPFIIRNREDGYYTLVGDAYIQGMAKAEVWVQNKLQDKANTEMIGLK